MTNNKSVHRSIAVLKLPRPVGALITLAAGIVTAMTGNAAFTTPSPALAIVLSAITALQVAETAALSRIKGAVVARNDKRAALELLLRELRDYVQHLADGDPENSAALIVSAAMAVKRARVTPPRAFTVSPGPVSGSAKLVVPSAGRRVFYEWATSTDGGKTWTPSPSTLKTRTVIPGLAVGSTVEFRTRTVTKAGEGDWSQTLSLLVK